MKVCAGLYVRMHAQGHTPVHRARDKHASDMHGKCQVAHIRTSISGSEQQAADDRRAPAAIHCRRMRNAHASTPAMRTRVGQVPALGHFKAVARTVRAQLTTDPTVTYLSLVPTGILRRLKLDRYDSAALQMNGKFRIVTLQ